MVLISTKFRQLWSQISLKILIPLRSNIKHSKECFIRYPTTSKSFKKLGLRPRFSTRFSVFGYPMKHSFSCLIYYIKYGLFLDLTSLSFPTAGQGNDDSGNEIGSRRKWRQRHACVRSWINMQQGSFGLSEFCIYNRLHLNAEKLSYSLLAQIP